MGRGRQKAKQTKIARKLKYLTTDTDYDELQKELSIDDEEVGVDEVLDDVLIDEPDELDEPDDIQEKTAADSGDDSQDSSDSLDEYAQWAAQVAAASHKAETVHKPIPILIPKEKL
jgi:cell division protein FtsX